MRYLRYVLVTLLVLMVSLGYSKGDPDSLRVVKPVKDSVFTISPGLSYLYEPQDVLIEGMMSAGLFDSTEFYINKCRATMADIRKANNFIKNIDEASEFNLPVGLKNYVDGIDYDFGIYAIRLLPTHAELDIFMEFTVPNNNQTLSFMVRGVKYTKKGGIVGDATLELLGDFGINFNGGKIQLFLKGGQTHATMDCDGLKELEISADVIFSRDLIVPEQEDGKIAPAPNRVTSSFNFSATGWNDLIVQLQLPAFQMTNIPGVSISAQDVVFDFSDIRNAPNVVFPEDYNSTQMLPGNSNLWRGFYMRSLTVKLPPEFKVSGGIGRPTFNASNVIIDNMGVTGKFEGTDLINIQNGDMSGWAFSMNYFYMEVRTNHLVEAKFNGDIVIPIAKEDKPFEYSALISEGGNYLFHVSPMEGLEFDVFKTSHVEIYEASYLDIKVENGKFLPKANLHGKMNIRSELSEGGQGVSLLDIAFEDLTIQTVKPYVSVGYMSFGSEAGQQMMAGFPISIDNVALGNISDTEIGLKFNLKLNLVGEESGAFAADAGLTIVGKMETNTGRQKWKYDRVQVDEIGIDIDGGAFKFNGRLRFYRNDVAYGDGFNGSVKAEFKPGIKVQAAAIFGNVNGMRYWLADAMVNFPTGIPIFTGVGIYGFGGGAYYRMRMDTQGLGSDLGMTPSGIVYVPDENSGLGLKAVVAIGSHPKPEAFNGDVAFEISFFKGGGVRYISFTGNGYLVTPGLDINVDKLKEQTSKLASKVKSVQDKIGELSKGKLEADGEENSLGEIFGEIGEKAGKKGSISAHVKISYDFENRVLHGNFEMFINVAGGIITGTGDGGRAGWAVLHFAPHEWYIYVGTPEDRIGISVGIGSLRASATSYFMVGTKILGSPPPPENVRRILKGNYDYMSDLNALGTGAGFAFGAALEVSTGDLTFLMFYARFDAGAGFDIMLKDYGDQKCKGSNDRIGINGWYANGQAYAYFEGKVGIRVKVFGRRRKISILEIGAAALLQAQLPNPFWMQGTVGGYFSILGGLVKGNCKFQVTIGDKCELQQDQSAILDDIKVIADLTPAEGVTNVDVFTTPQALFNMLVEQEFTLIDDLDGYKKRSFKIKLDYFKVTSEGRTMPGTIEWNDTHDVLAFKGHETLPSKKSVVIEAQVSFEEKINGIWSPVISEGQRYVEKMSHSFTSGEAPDYIPHHNVAYSYPVIGQAHFLKSEHPSGYITLSQHQDLFNPEEKWKQEGRFISQTGEVVKFFFTYSYTTKTIDFTLPELKLDQPYTIELVNVPAVTKKAVDSNVTSVSRVVDVGGEGTETEVNEKRAEGTIEQLEEKVIYSAILKTSMYPTFTAKMNAFSYSEGWLRDYQRKEIYEVGTTLQGGEFFDMKEIGNDIFADKNLIQFEGDLAHNDWYNNYVKSVLYTSYPLAGTITLDRTLDIKGLPPTKSVYVLQRTIPELTNGNALSFQSMMPSYASLIFGLPLDMHDDFQVIRNKAANMYLQNSNAVLEPVLFYIFPMIRTGNYDIKMKYKLPGLMKVTTTLNRSIRYR